MNDPLPPSRPKSSSYPYTRQRTTPAYLIGIEVGRLPDHALDAAGSPDDLVDGYLQGTGSGENKRKNKERANWNQQSLGRAAGERMAESSGQLKISAMIQVSVGRGRG